MLDSRKVPGKEKMQRKMIFSCLDAMKNTKEKKERKNIYN